MVQPKPVSLTQVDEASYEGAFEPEPLLIVGPVPGGGGGGGGSTAWSDITGKPTTFTPSAHTQAISTVTGLNDVLSAKASAADLDNTFGIATEAHTIADEALGKANTAVQPAAIANFVPNTRTVAGKPLSANVALDKIDVGLASVDNTSDANKPVSTAQQAALDSKVPAETFDLRVNSEVQRQIKPSKLGLMWAALATRNASPVPVVFAGSSTISGTGASSPDRSFMAVFTDTIQKANPLRSGATQPTFKTLANTTTPLAVGIQGVNAGVAGTTASNFLTSTTRSQIAALAPRIVVIQVGSNDYSGNVVPNTYRTNLENQINLLRTAINAPCLFVLMHQYRRGDVASPTYPWEAYGTVLSQIAESASDVMFVNTQPYFDQAGVPTPDSFHLLADTVHPNDAGHAMLAETLLRLLGVPLVIPGAVTPPVGPVTVVSDNFNRADGSLGTADTGQTWTTVGSNVIASQKASGTGTATVGTDLRDMDISADIAFNGSPTGLVFRSDTNANRLGIFIQTGSVIFYRTVGSANTNVKQTAYTFTSGQVYALRCVVQGSTIQVYINGTLFDTVTIDQTSADATAGLTRVGWRISSGTNTVDNFLVKSLA